MFDDFGFNSGFDDFSMNDLYYQQDAMQQDLFQQQTEQFQQQQFDSMRQQQDISTHAPTKGATIILGFFVLCWVISTHAPTKGATSHIIILTCFFLFQLTHPRRVRRRMECLNYD